METADGMRQRETAAQEALFRPGRSHLEAGSSGERSTVRAARSAIKALNTESTKDTEQRGEAFLSGTLQRTPGVSVVLLHAVLTHALQAARLRGAPRPPVKCFQQNETLGPTAMAVSVSGDLADFSQMRLPCCPGDHSVTLPPPASNLADACRATSPCGAHRRRTNHAAITRHLLDDQPRPVSHYCHVVRAGNLIWSPARSAWRRTAASRTDVTAQFDVGCTTSPIALARGDLIAGDVSYELGRPKDISSQSRAGRLKAGVEVVQRDVELLP